MLNREFMQAVKDGDFLQKACQISPEIRKKIPELLKHIDVNYEDSNGDTALFSDHSKAFSRQVKITSECDADDKATITLDFSGK